MLPFMMVPFTIHLLKIMGHFMFRQVVYGAELITYNKKDKRTISDVYDKVKELVDMKDTVGGVMREPTVDWATLAKLQKNKLLLACKERNLSYQEFVEPLPNGDSEVNVVIDGRNGLHVTNIYNPNNGGGRDAFYSFFYRDVLRDLEKYTAR